jgi:selenocysteine lyase/cysteine desulfurase
MKTLRSGRTEVREVPMTNGTIYLDYNATTPLLPEVVDAMLPFLREHERHPRAGPATARST